MDVDGIVFVGSQVPKNCQLQGGPRKTIVINGVTWGPYEWPKINGSSWGYNSTCRGPMMGYVSFLEGMSLYSSQRDDFFISKPIMIHVWYLRTRA